MYLLSLFLKKVLNFNESLSDGLVILGSLPLTVNMIIIFTSSAGGDELSAIINASLSNILGVFLTPALLLLYLSKSSEIDPIPVVLKLCYRILIPIIIG